MNNKLEMLTAREQLMEDIDCIIEANFGEVEYKDDVIRMLCDAADEELTPQDEQDLYDDYIGTFWEADDADDLVDEITNASGWCINSIDYRIILK